VTVTTPLSVLPYRPSHCRPTWAVFAPSLRSPLSSIASTPPPCGAVSGSASSSTRRAFTRSGSHTDSDKKNCSRCTAGSFDPVTGSAPARAVSVLFRSRGASSPGQVLKKPPALCDMREKIIETGRVLFQRTRRKRARYRLGHHPSPASEHAEETPPADYQDQP
jgi:hypothetical protein